MSESWRVAQPCSIDPATIAESGFCEHCQKTVHDLSRLTRKQALKLYKDHDGQLCCKLQHDADGRVQFRPEPPSFLARASLIGISLLGSASAAEQCSVEIRATDPSGAVIPNASVILLPKTRAKGWTGVSNPAGIVQTQVATGAYNVEVHAVGFQSWKRKIVCGEVQQPVKVEAVLEVGEITIGVLVVETPTNPLVRAAKGLFRR